MEALLLKYGYIMIFPLSLLEGQISTLLCGFLVSTGHFQLRIVFLIIWTTDIANDIFYYRIGRKALGQGRLAKIVDKSTFLSTHLELMKNLWIHHPIKTMILGKNAYIISIAVIASAGKLKLPFHRFLLYSIPASLIQPTILLFVGYYLGTGYALAANYVQYPGIIIACLFIGIIFFSRQIGKYISKWFGISTEPPIKP